MLVRFQGGFFEPHCFYAPGPVVETPTIKSGRYLRAATLQKCGVRFLSVLLCNRCLEIWREILVKFSACYVFQGLGVRIGVFHIGKGSLRKGLFTGGISRISRFSRISRRWPVSPLFSTVWGSLKSLDSLDSLESLENGLF